MGNPLKPGVPDLQALSWAEYGPKVGAWRLLDLLDRERVRAVFYTSGVVAERYPDLPAAIAGRGHAVAAHGWSQGTLPPYLNPEAEQADIARCVDVLTRTRRPASGRLAEPALHAEHGDLAPAGARGVPLACGHVRCGPAVPDRHTKRGRWSACRSPWR